MNEYNNVLDYPQMTRQREESIQSKNIAYAEDVNIELNHIMDTYNVLVKMLTGEWGDGTGKIYELVDTAIDTAKQALNQSKLCVLKTGDTMTGQLNTELAPVSDYNMVNKKYVDGAITDKLADPINRITNLETFKDNLKAEQVKLENTNFQAKNVHDGMSELFISVSSGKRLVAAAITGKGVETAGDASFSQMADNINSILTFVDGTSGGTATADEIFEGKTAYARGQLLVGKFVPPPSMEDSNATGADLLIGKVAYTKNGKIVGRLDPSIWAGGGVATGPDTSDATAYSDDIVYGKTAYARGQKLIGTLTNMNVEELYSVYPDSIRFKDIKSVIVDPITGDTIIPKKTIYSKDKTFAVRLATLNDEYSQVYIESYAIDEDGYYIQKGASIEGGDPIVKKYRYGNEELGIAPDEKIVDIALGMPNIYNAPKKCWLYILTNKEDPEDNTNYGIYTLYTRTYHLSENGVIGQSYDGEYVEDYKYDLGRHGAWGTYGTYLVTPNLVNNIVVLIEGIRQYNSYSHGTIKVIKVSNKGITIDTTNTERTYPNGIAKFTEDDSYIYTTVAEKLGTYSYASTFGIKFDVANGYRVDSIKEIDSMIPGTTYYVKANQYNSFYVKDAVNTNTSLSVKINPVEINGYMYSNLRVIGVLATRELVLVFTEEGYVLMYKGDITALITPGDSSKSVNIDAVGFNLKASIIEDYSYDLSIVYVRNKEPNKLTKIEFDIDGTNIVGVKYKNKVFYTLTNHQLSAGQPDVAKGKTFIGYMGTVEVGTKEVP